MIKITGQQRQEILQHARQALPHEACGLLAGREGLVEKVFTMTNTSETPELCYFMDAKEQLKIMKEIRNSGLELVGIYHSHPASAAYPSEKDVALAYYPDVDYIIISFQNLDQPEMRAFSIIDGKIKELGAGHV
ncbi:M67 family metallopeptidase [Candidatus Saganbacteria bacterium]|nr:M67 family metallopeptidase [Candidatus Saganbacteria bacterium]